MPRCRFVNVLTGASLKVQIPPEYGRVVASADGCLVLENKTTRRMRLLNPMTMAVADLPYLFVFLHPDDQFINVEVTGAGIVSDGGGEAPLTVVVCMTVGNLASIFCAKPGDFAWRLVDAGMEDGEVPMFEGGLTVGDSFYVPRRTGDVLKVVLRPRPRLAYVARLQDGRHRVGGFGDVRFYLVPSLDDDTGDDGMLLVRDFGDQLDVYQVNVRNRRITELHDMGERTIFLPSLTLRGDKFPVLHEMMGMLTHDDVEMYI